MATVSVRKELETIRLKHGGTLTEEAIVSEARTKKHPLHDRFTWDNTAAAKLWRLEEARTLIRSVYVTIERPRHKSVTVRAYASLPSDRDAGLGYRSITEVMGNRQQRKELLTAALSELEAFKRRFGNLTELVPVFDALESVKVKTSLRVVRKPTRQQPQAAA